MTLQGDVFSWGRNIEGQLGDDTTESTVVPSAAVYPIRDYGASDGFDILNIGGDQIIDGITRTIPSSAARWTLTGESNNGNDNYVVEDNKLKWDGTGDTSAYTFGTMASNYRVQQYRWQGTDVEFYVDWDILQWDQPSSGTNEMRLLLWVSNVAYVIVGRRINSVGTDETYIIGSTTGTITWANSQTSGKFRFDYVGANLIIYVWNTALSRWEWNGNPAGYTATEDLVAPVFIFQHIQQSGSAMNVEWSNLNMNAMVPRGNPSVTPGYETPGFAYWEQPQSALGGIGNPFLEFSGDTPGTTANNIQRDFNTWEGTSDIIHPFVEGTSLPLWTVAGGNLYWDGITNNPNGARDLHPLLIFENDFEIIWQCNIISAPNTCCWSVRLSCYQFGDVRGTPLMSFEPEYGYSGARRYRVGKDPGTGFAWQNGASRTDAVIRIKIVHRNNDWEAYAWYNGIWNAIGTSMTQTSTHGPTVLTQRFSNWSTFPGFQADFESLTIVPSGTPDGSFYWADAPFTVSPSGFTDGVAILVGDPEFEDMVGGRNHAVGLKNDGSAYAWGDNQFGQLGDGTLVNKSSPVSVLGNHSFTELAPASDHNLALKEDGSLFGWGRNDYRQLGSASPLEEATTVDIDNFDVPEGEDQSDNFEYNTLLEFQEVWGVSPFSDLIEVGKTGWVSWQLNATTPTSYDLGTRPANGGPWMYEVWLTDLVGDTGGQDWIAGLRYTNNDGETFTVGRTRFDHRLEAPGVFDANTVFAYVDSKLALTHYEGIIYAWRVDSGGWGWQSCLDGISPFGCSWEPIGSAPDNSTTPGWGQISIFVENRGAAYPYMKGKFRQFRQYRERQQPFWVNVAGTGDFSGDGLHLGGFSQHIIWGGYSRVNDVSDYNPTWTYQTIPAGQDFDCYTMVDIDFLEGFGSHAGILLELDNQNFVKMATYGGGPDYFSSTHWVNNVGTGSGNLSTIGPGTGFGYNRFIYRIARTNGVINTWYLGPALPNAGDPTGWDENAGWHLLEPSTGKLSTNAEVKIGMFSTRGFDGGVGAGPFSQFQYWRDTGAQPNPFEPSTPLYPTSPFDIGQQFITTTTGLDHSLAIDRDMQVWAWGRNNFGQCGTGTASTSANASPALVIGLPNENFVKVTAGAEHSCAMTELGDVWCWGGNTYKQLPSEHTGTISSMSPAKIDELNDDGMSHCIYMVPSEGRDSEGEPAYMFLHSTERNGSESATQYSIDISDPFNLSIADSVTNTNNAYDRVYTGLGGLSGVDRYIGWLGWFNNVISTFDWNNKANLPPSPIHDYQTGWGSGTNPEDQALNPNGNFLYIANSVGDRISVLNVSNPFSITNPANKNDATNLNDVAAVDMNENQSYLYTLCAGVAPSTGRLVIWDLSSNGYTLTYKSHIEDANLYFGGRSGKIKAGPLGTPSADYVFVNANAGWSVIDVSDKNNPTIITTQTTGSVQAYRHPPIITSDGKTIFIPYYSLGNGVRIWDITDPTNPQWYASLNVGTTDGVEAMWYDEFNEVLYLGCGSGGAKFFQSWNLNIIWSINPKFSTSPVSAAGQFFDIDAGGYHTLALKENNQAWAWGRNDLGQLGDNSLTNKSSPVSVYTTHKFVDISAGEQHSLAMKADGTICTWGAGDWGKLLWTEDENPRSTPTCGVIGGILCVPFLPNTGNYAHSTYMECGTQFIAWTWGCNTDGKLGDGTITNRSTPTQVIGNKKWIDMSGGGDFTIAIDQDGHLYAWGDDSKGQLGDG